MYECAFEEHGDRRDAATHVDDGRAKLHLVRREHGKATGVRGKERAGDGEPAAFDGKFEILQRRRPHRDAVHLHADALAEHAARVAHAARFVHDIGHRRALNDLLTVRVAIGTPIGQEIEEMRIGDERAVQRHG